MNVRQAEQKGYKRDHANHFKAYERDGALELAKVFRKKGYRALVAKDPASRVMSRGRGMKWAGGGWAVMYREIR